MDDIVDERAHNKELYNALIRGEGEEVIKLCRKIPERALHILTIHDDTVLHMATYSKQKKLVLTLLEDLPENQLHKLTRKNDIGNTILHEAATSNRIVPAAKKLLQKAPKELLSMRNKRGETAVFRAARYGKSEIFKFLDDEVNKLVEKEGREEAQKAFYHRDDKTTILHMSILYEYFDLALWIAMRYKYLVGVRDGDGMTALQLLACNPSAFVSGRKQGFLKRLIYSCVVTQDTAATEEGLLTQETAATEEVESCYQVPFWEAIRKQKQRFESALRLAKFLISIDTSWEATQSAMDQSKPKIHKYGESFSASQGQEVEEGEKDPTRHELSTVKTAETPLFLATKEGILEIVEEILNTYPQAVEHIDREGRNILHVAIKYRQIHIFDFVVKMEIPMMRLIRKTENTGNSILHMVGIKADDRAAEELRSPALLLQEDMLLFEKIFATYFIQHFNSKGQTAEVLFATNNAKLRTDAQEWLKRTAENCSIVAVLIATVAFAAAYTVPGGPNQSTGYPLLLNQSFFVIFTMTDVLSLTFALTSVITFLSILTSSFWLKDFKQSLPQKLMLEVTLLIFSVSMMMLAFAATVILMISNKQQWTRVALYSVAFLPVTIFAFSYLPLYLSLLGTFKYSLKKIGGLFPRFSSAFIRSWVANSFRFFKSQTKIPSQATSSTSSAHPCTTKTTHSFV